MRLPSVAAALVVTAGCTFASPPNVEVLGGHVEGMWVGGVATLRLAVGDEVEDLAVPADSDFAFERRLTEGTSFVVTVVDAGPDHTCVVENGSGEVAGGAVTPVVVSCTSAIPVDIDVVTTAPFTFDPRVSSYQLPVSALQQEIAVRVIGPTLTGIKVGGVSVASNELSPPVSLAPGQTTVSVELEKGSLSRRYDLIVDRGAVPIAAPFTLRADNAEAGDGFGAALAMSGEFLAVGAPYEDSSVTLGNNNNASDSGAVYIFQHVDRTWTLVQRLKGSALTANRWFGAALAMDGDTLVVGAPGDDGRAVDAGAAYVFRLVGARWNEEARLTASDARTRDAFGGSVAVSGGGLVVVGAAFRETSDGAVFTYRRNGTAWVEDATTLERQTGSLYGYRVALHGDSLAVLGGRHEPVDVYRRSATAWVSETVPLQVGDSVSLGDGVMVVGSPFSTPTFTAVLERIGGVWQQTGQLPGPGGVLGSRTTVRGDVIAGFKPTPAGLHAFQRIGGTWVPLVSPDITGRSAPLTLASIAVAGSGVVVGDYSDDGPSGTTADSGTAWLFE